MMDGKIVHVRPISEGDQAAQIGPRFMCFAPISGPAALETSLKMQYLRSVYA